jgi:hypothetical protein
VRFLTARQYVCKRFITSSLLITVIHLYFFKHRDGDEQFPYLQPLDAPCLDSSALMASFPTSSSSAAAPLYAPSSSTTTAATATAKVESSHASLQQQQQRLETALCSQTPQLQGGCLCGATRYQISPCTPEFAGYCHCSICRRAHGSTRGVAWFTVPAERFCWLTTAPSKYKSSPTATRFFCGTCGSQLCFQRDSDISVDVVTASLDHADVSLPPALIPVQQEHPEGT